VEVISFLTSDFVDDLLLTKSEAYVFAGETFDIDFKSIRCFSWPSLVLSVYVGSIAVYLIALNISGVWLIQTLVPILHRLLREPGRSQWHRMWHYKTIKLEWRESAGHRWNWLRLWLMRCVMCEWMLRYMCVELWLVKYVTCEWILRYLLAKNGKLHMLPVFWHGKKNRENVCSILRSFDTLLMYLRMGITRWFMKTS